MSWKALLAVAVGCGLAAAGRADDPGTDDEGFIRVWLAVGPIPLADGADPADQTNKEQLPGEAKLAPKDGDKAKAGDVELTWRKVTADDYYLDLNAALEQAERSVAYLVCTVTAEADKTCTLKIGSDDQCKVYVNGKDVLAATDDRAVDKDQNEATDVPLKKGANTLVFKVINNGGEWKACARFVDADGNPVKGLKVTAGPAN